MKLSSSRAGPARGRPGRAPEPLQRIGSCYRRTLYGGAALLSCLILAATAVLIHARMTSFADAQQYRFAAEKSLIVSRVNVAEVRARQMVARYDAVWNMRGAMPVPAGRYQALLRQQGGAATTGADLSPIPQSIVTTLTRAGDLQCLARLLALARDLAPGRRFDMEAARLAQPGYIYSGQRQFLLADPPFDLPAALARIGAADIGELIARQTFSVDAALRSRLQTEAPVPAPASAPGGEMVWVPPHDDPISGRRVVSHATPLFHQGTLLAVLVNDVPLDEFERRFLGRMLSPGFVLLAANGERIAGAALDARRGPALRAASARSREAGPAAAGRASVFSSDGAFILTQPVADTGWTLAYLFDDFVIVAGLRGEIALMLLLTLGVCAALWAAVFLFDKYVFSRLHGEAERALESEQFKRIILATAPVGLCVLDYRTGRVVIENELAARYTHAAAAHESSDSLPQQLLAAYRRSRLAPDAGPQSAVAHREVSIDCPGARPLHLLAAFARGRHEGREVLLCGLSDIGSRKQAEQLLLDTKRAADAANAAKSRFLASMSHEIRTPLHGALGHLELLGLAPIPAAQRELVAVIHDSFTALLRIVNDVLDVSKLEAEQMHLERAPVDLVELVEGVARIFLPLTGKKDLRFFCLIDPQTPDAVLGDAMRIRQILNNLLSNAVKFTETGNITVRLALLERQSERYWFRLQVIDSGIGIAKHEQDGLFAQFAQANGAIARAYGGTGLGLALCQRLSELMGGRISLASELGVGCALTVDLPFDKAPASAPAVPPALLPLAATARGAQPLRLAVVCGAAAWRADLVAQFSAWGAHVDAFETLDALGASAVRGPATLVLALGTPGPQVDAGVHDVVAQAEGAGETMARFTRRIMIAAHGPLRPRTEQGWVSVSSLARRAWLEALQGEPGAVVTVPRCTVSAAAQAAPLLVVEDDAVSRQLLVRQLGVLGFVDLDTAHDGREGLEKCLVRPYALVLSDVSMPAMGGYELVRALRSEGLTVPVVIVTAGQPLDAAQTEERQAREIAGFLGKPVLLTHLQALLETLLADFPPPAEPSTEPLTEPPTEPPHAPTPAPATDAAPRTAMPLDAELYALFLETVEADLEVLRRALRQEDREAFLRGTHKLKGALAILGETALVQACGKLSKLARQQPLVRMQDALERFERALKGAMARIEIL